MRTLSSKKFFTALLILLAVFSLVSCAPGELTPKEYGFFHGLWHGFIVPFAVIGKIFNMDHGIYALNNSGTWYWVGFFFGLLIIGVGGGSARRK